MDAGSVKARLEKLGAKIKRNEQGEIVEVKLSRKREVTDAGLVHLSGLTSLQTLYLIDTQITDAGLVHLAGLTSLQTLILWSTQITGPGLVHLRGLTSLQELFLSDTQITDAGVAKLKEVLPDCSVLH